MRIYTVWFWNKVDGVMKGYGHEEMTDFDAARRAALTAERRGYHANVITGGKLVYAR